MSNKSLNLAIVVFGICSNLYGLHGVKFGLPMPEPVFGGHYQFLTIVSLLVATISLFFRFFNILTGAFKAPYESLSAIATPIEGLVSALYWPIVIYDKKLLVPDDTTFDLPLGLDITLHLMPAIVCWIDFLVFNTGFKKSPVHTLSIYTFTFFYYIWVKKCFEMNGWWAYPLLGMLTTLQRAFFFVFSAFFCSRIYSLIALLHGKIHKQKKE